MTFTIANILKLLHQKRNLRSLVALVWRFV